MAPKIDPSKLQREQVADRIVNLSSHEMQLNVLQQHSAVPKTNVSQRIQVEVLLQIERLSGAERPVTKGRKKKSFHRIHDPREDTIIPKHEKMVLHQCTNVCI